MKTSKERARDEKILTKRKKSKPADYVYTTTAKLDAVIIPHMFHSDTDISKKKCMI